MESTIAATRRAVGWSMQDLANKLGVNVSTVSRMESSERDGAIKLSTLRRALDVMGRTLRIDTVPNRREERVTLELHRAVARKLRSNPRQNSPFGGVLSQAERREALERSQL